MKLVTMLLVGLVLVCISGIASAAGNSTDMSKMIDMDEVKNSAGVFWDSISSVGYLILGSALAVTLLLIVGTGIIGAGKSALGGKAKDSNTTNEGRSNIKDAILAALGLVLTLLVIAVLFGML